MHKPQALFLMMSLMLGLFLDSAWGLTASELQTIARPTGSEKKAEGPSFAIDDSTFILSPSDRIRIRWWGIGSGDEELIVNTRKQLVIPNIGTISVDRKSLREVQDTIEAMYKKKISINQFDIQIVSISRARITVTGIVPNPGIFDVPPGTRLSEILGMAGWDMKEVLKVVASSTPPRLGDRFRLPSARRILVIRAGSDSTWCDLARAYNAGDEKQDPRLFTGDKVHIIQQSQTLALTGDAPVTGFLELIQGETAGNYLNAAGVTTPFPKIRALLSNGKILDIDSSIKLDTTINVILLPSLMHRQFPPMVWVSGRVRNPGGYLIQKGINAQKLVELAGGIPGGDDSGVVVAVKRGWNWLQGGKRIAAEPIIQLPEVKQALQSYAKQISSHYSDPKIELQPGDSVVVYQIEKVVWVGGEVNQPGFVTWSEGKTYEQYVSDAGGFTNSAWKSKAKLFNIYTDQLSTIGGKISPASAIIIPEKHQLYAEQWIPIVATMVSLIVSVGTFYLAASQ